MRLFLPTHILVDNFDSFVFSRHQCWALLACSSYSWTWWRSSFGHRFDRILSVDIDGGDFALQCFDRWFAGLPDSFLPTTFQSSLIHAWGSPLVGRLRRPFTAMALPEYAAGAWWGPLGQSLMLMKAQALQGGGNFYRPATILSN